MFKIFAGVLVGMCIHSEGLRTFILCGIGIAGIVYAFAWWSVADNALKQDVKGAAKEIASWTGVVGGLILFTVICFNK